jgi:GNAT superfamily N-acetyltransferase
MKSLLYLPLEKGNETHLALFTSLLLPYAHEIDQHVDRTTPDETLRKWASGILNRMDSPDRLLFVCYESAGSDEPIGFLYGKIDREGDRGYVRPGWGYVMEFYVRPAFRRRGYGREMTAHLEEWFASRNIRRLYLTADPVTGVPFWGALGYTDSGTVSPENGQTIFEKTI